MHHFKGVCGHIALIVGIQHLAVDEKVCLRKHLSLHKILLLRLAVGKGIVDAAVGLGKVKGIIIVG